MTTATIDTREVREWANENGHKVGTAGRIPNAVIDAYKEAHKGKRRTVSAKQKADTGPKASSTSTEEGAQVIDLRSTSQQTADTGPKVGTEDAGRPTVFIVMQEGKDPQVVKPDAVYVDIIHVPSGLDEDTALKALHEIERLPKGDLRTRLIKEAAGALAG